MNEKYSLKIEDNETYIFFHLCEKDIVTFFKKENSSLKKGDKICFIESEGNKIPIVSPGFGQLTKIEKNEGKAIKLIISMCGHEMEFNGMCADCGIDLRFYYINLV